MSCGCHGKSGAVVRDVLAFEQCSHCTGKHLITAWSLFNECDYQQINLDAIAGQLRLAVNHCMYIFPELATKCRQIAIDIETAELDKVTNERFEEALKSLHEFTAKEHPEQQQRYEEFKASKQK